MAFDQVLITDIHHYTDQLFRFRTERPASHRFTAGEFNMITLDGKLKRAYSYTSSPYDEYLEFYSINVSDGAFTSQLSKMEVGDELMIGKKPTGSLLMTNFTPHENGTNLWLFATGTGIAPFISILRDPFTYEQFDCIFVVWSVSHKTDLQAFDEFLGEEADILYIPIVTQEPWANNERITTMIQTDKIMKYISPDNSRIMICGNMSFNEDMKNILEDRRFVEGTRNEPGTFVLERAFVES
jgi:ferredoxin--NADP+ reductase